MYALYSVTHACINQTRLKTPPSHTPQPHNCVLHSHTHPPIHTPYTHTHTYTLYIHLIHTPTHTSYTYTLYIHPHIHLIHTPYTYTHTYTHMQHTNLMPQCGFLLIRYSADSASVSASVSFVPATWALTCLKVAYNGHVTFTPHSDRPTARTNTTPCNLDSAQYMQTRAQQIHSNLRTYWFIEFTSTNHNSAIWTVSPLQEVVLTLQ